MEVVSVKVSKNTREKMRRLSHINWSETIRRSIAKTIEEEELKERRIDPREIEAACQLTDSIRRESAGWSSTEEIRRWRNQRR